MTRSALSGCRPASNGRQGAVSQTPRPIMVSAEQCAEVLRLSRPCCSTLQPGPLYLGDSQAKSLQPAGYTRVPLSCQLNVSLVETASSRGKCGPNGITVATPPNAIWVPEVKVNIGDWAPLVWQIEGNGLSDRRRSLRCPLNKPVRRELGVFPAKVFATRQCV